MRGGNSIHSLWSWLKNLLFVKESLSRDRHEPVVVQSTVRVMVLNYRQTLIRTRTRPILLSISLREHDENIVRDIYVFIHKYNRRESQNQSERDERTGWRRGIFFSLYNIVLEPPFYSLFIAKPVTGTCVTLPPPHPYPRITNYGFFYL